MPWRVCLAMSAAAESLEPIDDDDSIREEGRASSEMRFSHLEGASK